MDKFFGSGRSDDNERQEDNYPPPGANKSAGGLASFLGGLDFDEAKETADKHSGESGDRDLFGSILGSLSQKQNKLKDEDVDEDYYVNQHKKTYDDDDDDGDTNSLGVAAAMQALKKFNSGSTESSSQGAFLGLAMSEASKLFDAKASNEKVSSDTSKDAVVQKAAEAAMKMYFKSQGEQQGGLAGLASKFIK